MKKHYQLPILIEKDEDGFYVAECPVFRGCYTQGKTMGKGLFHKLLRDAELTVEDFLRLL